MNNKRDDPSATRYENTTTAPEADKKRKQKIEEAEHNILDGIPIVGRFFVWVRLRFGWAGVLLILTGFFVAIIMAYSGLLPKWLVSRSDEKPPPPKEVAGYQLVSDPEVVLAQALKNANVNMEISGVALSSVNLNTLKEKIERGFRADIVILHPCSPAVLNRTDDTGHVSGARRNILKLLEGINSYMQQLKDRRRQLNVRLSKRPATMVVSMFDRRRELYAYWCRYGAPCTKSPVLVLKNYGEKNPENAVANEVGLFFENHYDAVFHDADTLDFDKYDARNYDPCPTPSPVGAIQR